jgi:hypothetical protein
MKGFPHALPCLSLIALLVTGCASKPGPPDIGILHQQVDGYGILYGILKDEADVGKIFVIKHADDSVGDLVRQVGSTCTAARDKLETYSKLDPNLGLNLTNLPAIEVQSRDITASRTERKLLLSSGAEFELNLIFTQAQAMNYVHTLCDALSEHEQNADRKEFLKTLSQESGILHDRLMAMLTVKP